MFKQSLRNDSNCCVIRCNVNEVKDLNSKALLEEQEPHSLHLDRPPSAMPHSWTELKSGCGLARMHIKLLLLVMLMDCCPTMPCDPWWGVVRAQVVLTP